MADQTEATIDPVFVEWTDLCAMVASQTTFEGYQRWAFMVGTDGTPAERILRGRTAYARWGKSGPIEGKPPEQPAA